MTISTLINRVGMTDIPIEVNAVMNGDESFDCDNYGTVTKPYWNDDMTYQAYDIGDQIYLTDEEMDAVVEKAMDMVLDEMLSSQRISYNSYQLRESRGY